ncbi:PASTA domain-containing protein [Nonomuraea sp. NPDC050680]|uniref:PASTA domain-containing protein n=1 Tax=Nonomuraea sp. NPDC050680 TaxID=3154630 RepID=UPI0033C2AD87
MRRYGLVAYVLAASVMTLTAACLIVLSPATAGAAGAAALTTAGAAEAAAGAEAAAWAEPMAGAAEVTAPTAEPSCPTLSEWNSETHDGTRPGPVPNVMGMTRDSAVAALAQGGFDTDSTPSGSAGDWTVTDQTPTSEETADCGSTVTIDLRAPTVEVPDVVGDQEDVAAKKIRDKGLVPSVGEGFAADLGVVDAQDPAAGTQVPSGSTVTLTLRPPTTVTPTPDDRVEVPDLDGLSASAARRRLQGQGLTLVVGSGDSGRVSGQDPAAGTTVDRGSSVTVTLTPAPTPTDPASPAVTPAGTDESPQVSVIDPEESDSSSTPLPILLVAALVAAGVVVWALRRARRGRRTSATPSVVCVPYADLSPSLRIREFAPSLSLDFVCHHDQGRQEIREIVR